MYLHSLFSFSKSDLLGSKTVYSMWCTLVILCSCPNMIFSFHFINDFDKCITLRGKKEPFLSVSIINKSYFSFSFFFTDSNKLTEDVLPFIIGHCGEYMLPTSLSNVFHFPQQNTAPKRQDVEIAFSREKPVGLFKSLVRAFGFEDCWILDLCSGAGTTPI